MQQQYDLGVFLRDRYHAFLNKSYHMHEVRFIRQASVDVNRPSIRSSRPLEGKGEYLTLEWILPILFRPCRVDLSEYVLIIRAYVKIRCIFSKDST